MLLRKLSSRNILFTNNCLAFLKSPCNVEHAFFGSKVQVPAPPKRPLTAYMIFCKENRPHIVRENPTLSSPEQIKKLAKQWTDLSTEKKKPYEISAREYTLKYGEEHKKFYENLTEEQKELLAKMKADKKESRRILKLKKALHESGLPKPANSAYTLFIQAQAKNKLDVKIATDFLKTVAELWKKIPEDAKKDYEDQAQKDKDRYQKEMKAWRDKMTAENRTELIKAHEEFNKRGKKSIEDIVAAPVLKKKRSGETKENVINASKN